jgi:hypothetical protein
MLPTKFNTGTNDILLAEQFAIRNKERLISQYLERRNGYMYKFLEGFYEKKFEYLEVNNLTETIRKDNTQQIYPIP